MEKYDIVFDEEEHRYYVDGVEYPSVTTVLNYITADHYGSISPVILESARRRGSEVHEALEELDYTGDCSVNPQNAGYCRAYTAFLNDYRPEWYGIEKPLYSPLQGFCGTVDRYGLINGKPAVLDIKTTSSPNRENYLSLCCQTSAYGMLIASYKEDLHWDIADRYGLYLKSDGTYRLINCEEWELKNEADGRSIFIDCLYLYKTIKRITSPKKGRK